LFQCVSGSNRETRRLRQVHTLSCGAARPSDYDEHMHSIAKLESPAQAAALCAPADARLQRQLVEAVGAEWAAGWSRGLPDALGRVDGAGAEFQFENNPTAANLPVRRVTSVKGY
jgi:hypothetical protein